MAGALIGSWWAALALDLRSLALQRIVLSSLILLDLGIRLVWLEAHYSDGGTQPRSAITSLLSSPFSWSLHLAGGHWAWSGLLFLLQALAALALLVGYRTRVAGWCCWLLLVSLQNRNELILDGGDQYFRLLLFWLLFTPWGACWSWDSRGNPPASYRVQDVSTLAYSWQLSLIYAFAFLLKTGPEWTVSGIAAEHALKVDQLATPLAAWLLQFPDLLRAMTFGVLYFEALVPFLIWLHPLSRFLAVLGILALHLGLGLFLHLGVFAPVAATCALGLIPSVVWDRLGFKSQPGQHSLPTLRWPTQVLLLYLMLRATQWNIWTWRGYEQAPNPGDMVALRLDQKWNMFAPRPLTRDGYFVLAGETEQGEQVSAWLRGDRQIQWAKPLHGASQFPDARWRKLMMNLADPNHEAWRIYLLEYLTRRWNRHHPEEKLRSLSLYFVLEELDPEGRERELDVQLLGYFGGREVKERSPGPSLTTLESARDFVHQLQGSQEPLRNAPPR